MVSRRYAKANNPMVEGHDPDKPITYILYLDANNLYEWAMSQALPTGGFEWTDPPSTQELIDHPSDADKGYVIEVNVKYPEELHDAHNDYPYVSGRTSEGEESHDRIHKERLLSTRKEKFPDIGPSRDTTCPYKNRPYGIATTLMITKPSMTVPKRWTYKQV